MPLKENYHWSGTLIKLVVYSLSMGGMLEFLKRFFLKPEPILKCYLCGRTLGTGEEFDNHLRTVHR